jgi:uncharacterized membrane protein
MRFRHLDHALRKTLSFAVIHLLMAVAVGYALTGSFVLAGALALIEPAVNTLVHHRIEHAWPRVPTAWRRAWVKSVAFTGTHFVVAVGLGLALTGSLAVAGAQAVIEPLCNGAALLLFDRWWAGREARAAAAHGLGSPA